MRIFSTPFFASAFLLTVVAGCDDGSDTDATDTDVTDTDTTDTDDTDVVADITFSIEATALDMMLQAPAAEGTCVDLIDPSPAAMGDEPITLASTTVGVAGAVVFDDVVNVESLGLIMSVKDCVDADPAAVYTTATGIPYDTYADLEDGGTLSGLTAFSINLTYLAGLQASATAVGSTADLAVDGFFMGFVLDDAGLPIGGATVTCDDCDTITTYYQDEDSSDGLFSSGAGINAATDPNTGMFVIPGGPISNYTAEDGDVHTFAPQLNGSNPGSASVTGLYGI
jgi:hypothetical protein